MSQDAKVWTVGALLQWTDEFLASKGVESPRLEAQVLLAHALGCQRIQLYTRFEELAPEDVRTRFRELVQRRVAGAPVAHLVGKKEFYRFAFEVSPDVLIPRPATETLVMAALERLKPLPSPTVLDLGTGSGCIAVSIVGQHKGASAVAVDLSKAALAVATRNAAANGVGERIDFREGDLYAAAGGESFAMIVSNPPYIATAEIAALAKDVRDYEPHLALDGGADGFAVIDRVLAGAAEHLSPGGWLLVEVGIGQADEAVRRLERIGSFMPATTLKDGDGVPRVIVAKRA